MVPGAGVEPARPRWPADFKSAASTSSATRARVRAVGKWRLGPESNGRPRLCRPLHNHSATQPLYLFGVTLPTICGFTPRCKSETPPTRGFDNEFGAGNEIRTRDPNLGKVVLYQLSYSRVFDNSGLSSPIARRHV